MSHILNPKPHVSLIYPSPVLYTLNPASSPAPEAFEVVQLPQRILVDVAGAGGGWFEVP